jgi:DNA-binding SARP family transcriptional activator
MGEASRRRLNLLGGFALHTEGAPETPIRISTRKGRALLAYLAMQPGQRATREHLATLLWGDRSEQQARQCLRQCLARIRADLAAASADILHLESDAVALRTQALSVDALEFGRLAESGEEADLESAIALYRGEFLAGFHVDAEAFDSWMSMERERLAMLVGRALESLAARGCSRSRPRGYRRRRAADCARPVARGLASPDDSLACPASRRRRRAGACQGSGRRAEERARRRA